MRPEHQTLNPRCINTLRALAVNQVHKANSGRPGTPIRAASMAYCLWPRRLRFDPEYAAWPDRDRFVLSVVVADLQSFGQARSSCRHQLARRGRGIEP